MSSLVLNKLNTLLGTSPVTGSIAIVALVGLVTWLYFKLTDKYDYKTLNKISGPPCLPILGNALQVNVHPTEFLSTIIKMVKEHGSVMKFRLAHRPYVVLSSAGGFETIMSSNKHIVKGPDYRFIWPWLGFGLLTSSGSKWHSRRKMLTPAFHFKILDDFLAVMNDQSVKLAKKLSAIKPSETFDIFPYITYCALDIICESAMGRSVNAQDKSESQYVKSIFAASDLIFLRQMSPWLFNDFVFWLTPYYSRMKEALSVLHGFTNSVIQERKKERIGTAEADKTDELGRKRRLAFLDLLIDVSDGGRVLTDEDIREEVDTFMFEGHDTTAANMAFTCYNLAIHPEIQKRVQEELDGIFADDPDRAVTMEDLASMKYLECVIKESLRMYPSVPIMSRTIFEDTVIEGKLVPAGTHIILFNYLLHRDPEQFPDPDRFDPDRFGPDAPTRHPYAYTPFSAGPRNCIGQKFAMMEEKVVLAAIMRKFNLSSDLSVQDLKLLPELILRPHKGIPVTITPRKL